MEDKLLYLSDTKEAIKMCPDKEFGCKYIECNRCGDCCRNFTLPWSPKRMESNMLAAQRGEDKYDYNDDGVVRSDGVNAMMAVWYNHLVSVSIPDEIKAKFAFDNDNKYGLWWYRCLHLSGSKASYRCDIHDNRPYVCAKYKPHFQGGYLGSRDTVLYKNCSYYKEWPEVESKGV